MVQRQLHARTNCEEWLSVVAAAAAAAAGRGVVMATNDAASGVC